ncbi:hypothetical protein VFPFJ_02904 [Purpureocillium lilacinum]|uniref:Uncharacterized protein n=1 Tax=Purpureocillium lilacinum TaxID=33203 RepID=A0A179HV33_PURLI|nr:hypothetical protein VFPFJ_02904 [Purpureocillium lilacinum]OAQ93742.1 hypothetical protein VFPFJ_02904 [Purpureocillium lilacinum]
MESSPACILKIQVSSRIYWHPSEPLAACYNASAWSVVVSRRLAGKLRSNTCDSWPLLSRTSPIQSRGSDEGEPSVANLPPGELTMRVDGRPCCGRSHERLLGNRTQGPAK